MTVGSDGWAFQPLRQPVFIGQRFARRPCRALAQRLERGLGAILGFADHAREISVAHDGDQAGNGARAILRHADEFCRRHLRSQHAAMQHAGQRLVVNETGMGENLVGNIQPLNGISGQRALGR